MKHYFEIKYGFNKQSKLNVPEKIMSNCRNRIGLFYLAGLYYTDGTVNTILSNVNVRLNQNNVSLLKQVQIMLHANGILSKIYLRKKAHIYKKY